MKVNRSGSLCYPPGRQPRAGPFWRPFGMETEAIRALIRVKLRDGRLPSDGIPIALGRPGNEHKCDGCDEVLAITLLMMELTKDSKSFLLHGDCYIIWNTERLTLKS
jgi:hypothetical protein